MERNDGLGQFPEKELQQGCCRRDIAVSLKWRVSSGVEARSQLVYELGVAGDPEQTFLRESRTVLNEVAEARHDVRKVGLFAVLDW